MRSNLQRAVADVIAANKEVKFANVLTAYVRVAGFKTSSLDVLTAFERAMDKHPDSKEVDSESAKLVVKLRHDYWKTMFDWGGKQHCCPCCVDLVEQYIEDPDHFEETLCKLHGVETAPPPPAKKPKRKRQKPKRHSGQVATFDPYGPSTSASSM